MVCIICSVAFTGPTVALLQQHQQQQQQQLQLQQQDSGQQDSGQSYQQLLQQREEENRQEVERLTAEIRALKLQILQLTSKLFLKLKRHSDRLKWITVMLKYMEGTNGDITYEMRFSS